MENVLTGLRTRPRHQRYDDGGIHAAAQQCAQRHIADQPDADGFFQPPLQFLQTFVFAHAADACHTRAGPSIAESSISPLRNSIRCPARQFSNPLEDGARIGNIAEIEVLQQSFRIDLRQFWMHCENRLDLGSKQQAALMERVVQRLLAQPVASQQQRVLPFCRTSAIANIPRSFLTQSAPISS